MQFNLNLIKIIIDLRYEKVKNYEFSCCNYKFYNSIRNASMVGVAIVGIHLRLCHQQLTRERNFSLLAHVKTVLVNVSVTPRVVVSLQILAYVGHDRGSNTP